MTGPEFAAAHDNDSSTWMPADFETEINLAEIDQVLAAAAVGNVAAVYHAIHTN